jgi:N6-adenosine-specific RNA methylase IME4
MLMRTSEILQPPHPFAGLTRHGYHAIAADPPWRYECFSEKGKDRSADRHYETMAVHEIEQLPVGDLAARDTHLFLWVTAPCLVKGLHLSIMREWGFEPSALAFVWAKIKRDAFAYGSFFIDETLFAKGIGHTTRQNVEFVVLGSRGSPRRLRKDVHQLIIEPRREHSRKPDQFYARVERYCDGPFVDLFARERRPNWDVWGIEVNRFQRSKQR